MDFHNGYAWLDSVLFNQIEKKIDFFLQRSALMKKSFLVQRHTWNVSGLYHISVALQ